MPTELIVAVVLGALLVLLIVVMRGQLSQHSADRDKPPQYRGNEGQIPLEDLALPQPDAGEIARLRKNFRLKALGNEALIDRLVQGERDRQPGASEVDCYRAAIERWERDNR